MQFNSHGDSGVPTFTFDPAQTAGKFGANAGFGFASFLLGAANQAQVSTPNNTYGRRKSLAVIRDRQLEGHRQVDAELRPALGFQRTLSREVRTLVKLQHHRD